MDHHLAGRPEDLHPKDKPTVLRAAASADIVVACLGEKTYCETPGNIDYLTLDEAQLRLIEALAKTGKPVVTVLAESRHLVILRIVPYSRAIVIAHLPGEQREPWPTFCSAS